MRLRPRGNVLGGRCHEACHDAWQRHDREHLVFKQLLRCCCRRFLSLFTSGLLFGSPAINSVERGMYYDTLSRCSSFLRFSGSSVVARCVRVGRLGYSSKQQ